MDLLRVASGRRRGYNQEESPLYRHAAAPPPAVDLITQLRAYSSMKTEETQVRSKALSEPLLALPTPEIVVENL